MRYLSLSIVFFPRFKDDGTPTVEPKQENHKSAHSKNAWMLSTVIEDIVSRLYDIMRFQSVNRLIEYCEKQQILN